MRPEPFQPPAAPSGESTVMSSPLAVRGAHFRGQDWEAVIHCNRVACERECAQHGLNPESQAEVALAWATAQATEHTLAAALDFLRACHERAPFLFENAATFATIGRDLMQRFVGGLPLGRGRAILIAVADYVAGDLERASMVEIVEGLWAPEDFRPGMRVKTLRGAIEGVVLRTLPDKRVLWRPKGSATDLLAEPGSLLRVRQESGSASPR